MRAKLLKAPSRSYQSRNGQFNQTRRPRPLPKLRIRRRPAGRQGRRAARGGVSAAEFLRPVVTLRLLCYYGTVSSRAWVRNHFEDLLGGVGARSPDDQDRDILCTNAFQGATRGVHHMTWLPRERRHHYGLAVRRWT